MKNVINPIDSQSVREGKVSAVIHAIALDMMGRRSRLLQNAIRVKKGESVIYRKQSRLLDEYAIVLDAIHYQLEPTQWDPETSDDFLRYAQAHRITLPDWMFADRMKPVKTEIDQNIQETGRALDRLENEGGHI